MREKEVQQLLRAKKGTKEEDEKFMMNILRSEIQFFNKKQYVQVNDKEFTEKLIQKENEEKYFSTRNRYKKKEALFFYKIPLLLIMGVMFIGFLHNKIPYNILVKNASLSEYLFQKKCYHAALFSSLNFGNQLSDYLLYFPGLLVALFHSCKFFVGYQFILLLFSNSLLNTLVYYHHQKVIKKSQFLTPQTQGKATTLMFLFLPLTINPQYQIFNYTPYYIFPLFYLVLEIIHINQESIQNLRLTHISSILTGLILGRFLKKRLYIKV